MINEIGRLDLQFYQAVIGKHILSDEVILTENRELHIIERRGLAFYQKYRPYFGDIIARPDYIFLDDRPNTVLVCKSFVEDLRTVHLVIRLVVEGENPDYKNSIITAIEENDKRFCQRLRNRVPLYSKEDDLTTGNNGGIINIE